MGGPTNGVVEIPANQLQQIRDENTGAAERFNAEVLDINKQYNTKLPIYGIDGNNVYSSRNRVQANNLEPSDSDQFQELASLQGKIIDPALKERLNALKWAAQRIGHVDRVTDDGKIQPYENSTVGSLYKGVADANRLLKYAAKFSR